MENDEEIILSEEIPEKRAKLILYRQDQMLVLNAANILARLGRIEDAEKIGEILTEERKDELGVALAEEYERRGSVDKAIEVLQPSAEYERAHFIALLIRSGRIEEAKECCTMLGGHHSWIWPYSGIAKPLAFPSLPLLEGQGSIMAGSNVNSDSEFHLTRQSSPDLSKALILHSIHFNFTHAHLLHLMPSQMTQLTVTMIYQSMTFSTIYLS